MERKPKRTSTKDVATDPHRGLVYFDDVACRIKKFHGKGVRNLYSVVMTYLVKTTASSIRLRVGSSSRPATMAAPPR